MSWHRQALVGFDLETTGTEPLEARIVTAAVVRVDGSEGEPASRRTWLADPGIRIPAQASAIHGISSERAAAEGRPVREVADEIADALTGYWRRGIPVVAYNAAFDLTLLTAELHRHGLPSLTDRLDGAGIGPVVDPYTIDRAVDRYRKGKRNLEAVCVEYGVVHGGAHDAAADALAAVRVAYAIAARHPRWPHCRRRSSTSARSAGTPSGPPTSSSSCAARARRTRSSTATGRCVNWRSRWNRARRAIEDEAVRRGTSAPTCPRRAATPHGGGTRRVPSGWPARAGRPRRSSPSPAPRAAPRSRPMRVRPSRTPR